MGLMEYFVKEVGFIISAVVIFSFQVLVRNIWT